jgi:hypothetical protein
MDVRGKNVVVTGKVAGESRQTAEAKLRNRGANVQPQVGPHDRPTRDRRPSRREEDDRCR